MTALAEHTLALTVTSKEALRHWKEVTDKALREPVVITATDGRGMCCRFMRTISG